MSIPATKRARIYARDGYRCIVCGRSDDLTLDHLVPRSRGGTNADDNLRTMCGPCNQAKGNLPPLRWPSQQRMRAIGWLR